MVEDGLSDLGRWVRKLRDDPDSVLKIGGAQARGDLWTSTELLRLYDPESRGKATAGGLTRELKRAGLRLCYKGNPIKTAQGQVRLFAIRNPEQWFDERGPRIIEHYDASRSVTAAAPSQGKF
jgi:hypothetical protein